MRVQQQWPLSPIQRAAAEAAVAACGISSRYVPMQAFYEIKLAVNTEGGCGSAVQCTCRTKQKKATSSRFTGLCSAIRSIHPSLFHHAGAGRLCLAPGWGAGCSERRRRCRCGVWCIRCFAASLCQERPGKAQLPAVCDADAYHDDLTCAAGAMCVWLRSRPSSRPVAAAAQHHQNHPPFDAPRNVSGRAAERAAPLRQQDPSMDLPAAAAPIQGPPCETAARAAAWKHGLRQPAAAAAAAAAAAIQTRKALTAAAPQARHNKQLTRSRTSSTSGSGSGTSRRRGASWTTAR